MMGFSRNPNAQEHSDSTSNQASFSLSSDCVASRGGGVGLWVWHGHDAPSPVPHPRGPAIRDADQPRRWPVRPVPSVWAGQRAQSAVSLSPSLWMFPSQQTCPTNHCLSLVQDGRLHLQRLRAGVDAAASGHSAPAETERAAAATEARTGGAARKRSSRAAHGAPLHASGGHGIDGGTGGRRFSRGKLCPGMGSETRLTLPVKEPNHSVSFWGVIWGLDFYFF